MLSVPGPVPDWLLEEELLIHETMSFIDRPMGSRVRDSFRVADLHVSLCQGEKDSPEARFGGARTGELWQNPQLARVPLGDASFPRRTGHPFTVSHPCGPSQKIECVFTASPETIRREPREFDIRRSVSNRRTWQSARCVILLFFPRRAAVSKRLRSGNLRRVRSRVARDPRRADTPPSSGPRLTSLDWHFPSVFLSHRPRPDYDPVWVPASRLPPAHAGYVCCAVWKAVYASLCQRSSFHRRRARSNWWLVGSRENAKPLPFPVPRSAL